MAFTLPTFNLTVDIYVSTVVPRPAPPVLTTVCNMTPGKRVAMHSPYAATCYVYILLPALTDIRSGLQSGIDYGVECPAGSGRHYGVLYVDDVGKGFANEHRIAYLYPVPAWTVPYN